MAKDNGLPMDVTIPDVMGKLGGQKLRNPFKYVAGVYDSMPDHGWQTPGLRVRIGRKGTGAQPYYRIEQDGPDGSEKILGFYHGQGHSRFENAFDIQSGDTWSTQSMTFKEVQRLHDTLKSESNNL